MENTTNYCRVVAQTCEEVIAMYKSLVSTLVKSLFHVASGVRENNQETVRRYLHVIAEELAEHGYDRESSVITQIVQD